MVGLWLLWSIPYLFLHNITCTNPTLPKKNPHKSPVLKVAKVATCQGVSMNAPFWGPLEVVGPENQDFFGPWNLMYIKSPRHLFFIWSWDKVILMRAISSTQAIVRGGPWKSWGPNGTCFACCHVRAPKSLYFQGPTLTMALEIDVAHIKITSSRSI